MYKAKLSQEERILSLLKTRGLEGVKIWEFMLPRPMGGLGIAQYTARIWGLRRKGFNIINVRGSYALFG